MNYAPEMQAKIDKTVRGVAPLASLVTGLRYVENHVSKGNGSWLLKEKTEVFLSIDGSDPKSLGPHAGSWTILPGKRQQSALVCTPVNQDDIWYTRGEHIGSIRVIPWAHVGLCLVLRTAPSTYIGDEWLAFTPLQDVIDALQAVNPHKPA